MTEFKIIGLSGHATVGKDFFFSILDEIYPSIRFSLGDILKYELRESLIEETGIDILRCTKGEKESLRPKLVEYGTKKRRETDGKYFTNILGSVIDETFTLGKIPVITDIRYAEYENDEINWLKEELGGALIYIKKYSLSGDEKIYVEPPNEDEEKNGPILSKNADYTVDWPEVFGTFHEKQAALAPYVEKFVDWYADN